MAVGAGSDGRRGAGLILAALAALGWGAALYGAWFDAAGNVALTGKVAALENRIAQSHRALLAQDEIAALEASRDTLQAEVAVLTQEQSRMRGSVDALRTELLELELMARKAGAAQAHAAERLQSLRVELVGAQEDLLRTRRGIEAFRAERDQMMQARRAAAESVEADVEVDAEPSRVDELNRRLDDLRAELANARASLERHRAEQAEGERRVAQLRKEEEDLRRTLDALSRARDDEDRQAAERREGLAATISRLEEAHAGARENEVRLQAELSTLQDSVRAAREELTNVESTLATARAELARVQAQAARGAQREQGAASGRGLSATERRRIDRLIEDRPDGSRVIRVVPSLPSR